MSIIKYKSTYFLIEDNMSVKLLINNTLWSSIDHILSRGILMISGVLLARYLSAENFATYSYFQITTTMLATYSALGLGVAGSKYFAEWSIDSQNKEIIETISNLFGIAFVLSLLATLIILVMPNEMLSASLGISNITFAIAVLILSLNIIPSGAVLGLEKYKQAAIFSLINGFIFLFGVFLSVYYNEVSYSIVSFILAAFIQLLGNLFLIREYIKQTKLKSFFLIRLVFLRSIFSFIGPLVCVSLVTAGSGWILGRGLIEVYGAHVFSAYSIGLQWFALALFLPGMISRVVLPRLIREDSNNKKVLRTACLIALLFSFSIFLIGSFFRNEIISFYGDSYTEYSNIIMGFLFVALLYAPANTLGNAIIAKLGSFPWFVITMLWFICLMLVFYFRLNSDGILSVIYAQIIATSLLLSLSYMLCIKKGLI